MNVNPNLLRIWCSLLVAALLLLLYPLAHQHSKFLQDRFRSYDFFGDFMLSFSTLPVPDSFAVEEAIGLSKDSANVSPTKDSVVFTDDYTGKEFLTAFYEALERLGKDKARVRVAHFGDSAIEGDLITQPLRDSLQRRFGGTGIGYVGITVDNPKYRATVTQSFSSAWLAYHLIDKGSPRLSPGIGGEYFTTRSIPTNSDSSISYNQGLTATFAQSQYQPAAWRFEEVKLYYGTKPAADSLPLTSWVKVSAGQQVKEYPLRVEQAVNELSLLTGTVNSLRLDFSLSPNLPIYGLSFESSRGVHVDNFSARGNAGPSFTKVSSSVFRGFNAYWDYDLIILQFGLNIINSNSRSFKWYEDEMVRLIEHLKAAIPRAAILVVSVNDKSTSIKGVLQTDPSIPRLVQAQRRAATRTRSAYFDLFSAMGGSGSMIKWANDKPTLANKDYTHFNRLGSERVAGFIWSFLMTGYADYLQQKGEL